MNNKPLALLGALFLLIGLVSFAVGSPAEAEDPPSAVVGTAPRGPDPANYPGGLASRDYQRAARTFEAAMARHLEALGREADEAGARIEAEAFAGIWSSLGWILLVAGGMALFVSCRSTSSPNEAANAIATTMEQTG